MPRQQNKMVFSELMIYVLVLTFPWIILNQDSRDSPSIHMGMLCQVNMWVVASYVHIELGFFGVETIRAKQNYEKFCCGNGVLVQYYRKWRLQS
jgi:hypothetical protein